MKRLSGALGVAALIGACAQDPVNTTLIVPGGTGNNTGDGGSGGESSGNTSTADTSTGTATAQSAKEYYLQVAHPQLDDSCGNCHIGGPGTPSFLAEDAGASYDKIKTYTQLVTSDPTASRLITKGEHSNGEALALTEDQHLIVTTWLEKELAEAPVDPGDPGEPVELTPLQQLELFGSCISLLDFEETAVYELGNQTAEFQNNNVPCQSCHGAPGTNGAFISADLPLAMYDATKVMPWIMKFAVATLNDDGTFKDIVPANRWIERGTEDCPIGNCHPPYTLDQTVIDAINELYSRTKLRWESGDCSEIAEPPPPDGAGEEP